VARLGPAARVSERRSPMRKRSPLGPLVTSRIIDQGALGLGSLLLARALGPDAFAPVAVLFIVNSLAVQISDFGVGFAVYRSVPGTHIARTSLRRLRVADTVVAVAAVSAAIVLGGTTGVVLASAGLVWLLSAEGYIRKASAVKAEATGEVVRAEIAGAVVFFAGAVAVAASGVSPLWAALPFVVKHLVEVLCVASWRGSFDEDGEPARSGAEWLGQVMTYLVANVDYVLIGWLLGPELLSIYVVAFRLAAAIPAFIGTPITQTAFFEFARVDQSGRQAAYDHLLGRIVVIGLVGTAVLIVAAPLLPVVLGSEWDETAPVLAVLAVAVPWRLLLGTTVAEAITAGAARAVVVWETGRLVAMAALVAVATGGGLIATSAAVSLGTVVLLTAEHALANNVRGTTMPRWAPVSTAVVALGLVVVMMAAW
jgi:O-antigen/teichoic acid export membrane protein